MNRQIILDCTKFEAFYNKKPIIVFGKQTAKQFFDENSQTLEPNIGNFENTAFGYKAFAGNFEFGYQVMGEEDYKAQ